MEGPGVCFSPAVSTLGGSALWPVSMSSFMHVLIFISWVIADAAVVCQTIMQRTRPKMVGPDICFSPE